MKVEFLEHKRLSAAEIKAIAGLIRRLAAYMGPLAIQHLRRFAKRAFPDAGVKIE